MERSDYVVPLGIRHRLPSRQRFLDIQELNDPDCPYGVLSGVGRDQIPCYRATGIRRAGEWRQSHRPETTIHQRSDFPSTGNGPRDGGSFGGIVIENDFAYAEIYPGEATTDPEYKRSAGQLGDGLEQGYGELVPGIDGGRGYGYRVMNPRFALAQWNYRQEPHIPGGGGFVPVDNYKNHDDNNFGYRTGVDYGKRPEARGYSRREQLNMARQIPPDDWNASSGSEGEARPEIQRQRRPTEPQPRRSNVRERSNVQELARRPARRARRHH